MRRISFHRVSLLIMLATCLNLVQCRERSTRPSQDAPKRAASPDHQNVDDHARLRAIFFIKRCHSISDVRYKAFISSIIACGVPENTSVVFFPNYVGQSMKIWSAQQIRQRTDDFLMHIESGTATPSDREFRQGLRFCEEIALKNQCRLVIVSNNICSMNEDALSAIQSSSKRVDLNVVSCFESKDDHQSVVRQLNGSVYFITDSDD